MSKGEIMPGVAVDDYAAIHVVEGEIHRAVASRPGAKAYRVSVRDGVVNEESLATEFLGATGHASRTA